jgi:hypothetical protein
MRSGAGVVVAGVMVAQLIGCGSKSTCDKAVAKMIQCKIVVGNLLPGKGPEVFLDDAHGRLKGACDAAVDSSEDDKRRMECAAKASTCEQLLACQ